MKTALTFLGGALLASLWWAAALWGNKNDGINLTSLWWASGIATVFVVMLAVYVATDEEDN